MTIELRDLARRWTLDRPDATAVRCGGEALTFAELEERSTRVANGLMGLELDRSSPVAILDRSGAAFAEIALGAFKAGLPVLPLNFRLSPSELVGILRHAGCDVVFAGEEFASAVSGVADVRHLVTIGGDYAAWRDRLSDHSVPSFDVTTDDPAFILYTSGTTGSPKGVLISHRALTGHLVGHSEMTGVSSGDVQLLALPLFHVLGIGGLFVGLLRGLETILLRDFDPRAVAETICAEAVTMVVLVPVMISALVAHWSNGGGPRLVFYGGSPMSAAALEAAVAVWSEASFYQLYGLTETTGPVMQLDPADHRLGGPRLSSCGRALPGVTVRVVGPDDADLAVGSTGEVVCRSPALMSGYWNAPRETAEAMRGGWFHTGDLGYLDEDGYLFLQDRKNDLIVSGGENIFPAEVEAALRRHPAVAEAVVIGVPDERWGEAPKALVVLKTGVAVDLEEILACARDRMSAFKVPRSIERIEHVPRNMSGKVLRRELRAPYWAGRGRSIG